MTSTLLPWSAASPQTRRVQCGSVCADGVLGTGDGAGEEEATHAGDQATELGAGAAGRRESEQSPGEGDGGFLFHARRPGPGDED